MSLRKVSVALLLVVFQGFLFPAPSRAGFKVGVEGSSASKLSVKANQSFLIDTSVRVKTVSVAKPEIADVTVVSPKQLMVTGKAPGETTLIYWSEFGIPASVDVNVWSDNNARKDLERLVPGEKFELSGPNDAIILSGSVSTVNKEQRLVEAAKAYSKNVVNLLAVERVEQVMLQVRVAEVDRSTARELGFGFQFEQSKLRGALSSGSAFTPFFGNLRDQTVGNIGPNFSFSDAVNLFVARPGAYPEFAGLLHALADKGAMKMLAEPNLVVSNGSEGKFLAGGEFPVVYSTGGGNNSVAVMYKEFGVKLNFQPKIAPNGEIFLKIAQEVSDLDFANAVIQTGFRIPALRSRKAESSVQLADGQTFALAGLIDNKVSKAVSKIPLLGDIPILGALFRSTRYQNNETELVVMVTPRIIRPMDQGSVPPLPTEKLTPKEIGPSLLD